jgi:hypothetical protein
MMSTMMANERVTVLDEPELEFRFGQRMQDPRDGLALFGPYDADEAAPKTPAYIVLGPGDGIDTFGAWSRAVNGPFSHPDIDKRRLWPSFPGFEAAFCTPWAEQPAWTYALDRSRLLEAARKRDSHERCYAVVDQYLQGLELTQKLDTAVAVAVCVVPDDVWLNCRPESRVANPSDSGISREEKKSRRHGQGNLFEDYALEQYHLSPDFRRQLKARSMKFNIPLQLVRESTLRLSDEKKPGQRRLTPIPDRMWNLATALYYKAGGKPWRLGTARDGVCYIGLAFRRAEETARTACCAAQMFLNTGDGVVFLGEYGPWYSPDTKQFHLSETAANGLLAGVLATYRGLGGKELTEVFVHSHSAISDEEFAGYRNACPDGTRIVGVRVREDRFGPRLYRTGTMPVMRGTFWRVSDTAGYLLGAGFKPRLATYDGSEIPVPLRIDIQHGEASIDQVAWDIFGLTKLNYNACRLGEAEPVTVKFSDAVGEILISNPTVEDRRPNFKFYI